MGAGQPDRAQSRRQAAVQRHDQLEFLRVRLAAGDKHTEHDVEQAGRRPADAQRRAVEAEPSARLAHRDREAGRDQAG